MRRRRLGWRPKDLFYEVSDFIKGNRVLFRGTTMFGRTRILEGRIDGEHMRLLEVQRSEQSASYLGERWCELPFAYMRRFDCIFEAPHKVSRILLLGGGAMAYPRHIIANHEGVSIDVVEIDPKIIDLAHEYFFLDRLESRYHAQSSGRLTIHCDDAGQYLKEAQLAQVRYDAIINDCYQAMLSAGSPFTDESLEAIRACLEPGGLYVLNAVGSLSGEDLNIARMVGLLSPHFPYICALPTKPHQNLSKYGNVCVVACDEPIALSDAIPLMGELGTHFQSL